LPSPCQDIFCFTAQKTKAQLPVGQILREALYHVTTASSQAEFESYAPHRIWDCLIILGGSPSLLHQLSTIIPNQKMPIIVVLEAQNGSCRMQFLRAGADEILQSPITGKALLSRLRSLLRRRRARQEFALRADTNRALGFHEAKALFQSKPKCAVIQVHHDQTHTMLDRFHALKEYSLEITTPAALFLKDQKRPSNLCYILLDIAQNPLIAHNLLLSMRTHDLTRHAAIILASAGVETATRLAPLDLGADDVLFSTFSRAEIAHRIATQLEHKRVNDQLRVMVQEGFKAAVTDPLTGLYNRRYAMTHLCQQFQRATQGQTVLALFVLDLDFFKRVNDNYGHAAGDQVLRRVAKLLRHLTRASDMVARIGGEEFLVVLPDASAEIAGNIAERVSSMIRHLKIGPDLIEITASIGVNLRYNAAQTHAHLTAQELLEQADQALYRAKALGRNRVSYFSKQAT
jgi:two-component system cell cycle response regulator